MQHKKTIKPFFLFVPWFVFWSNNSDMLKDLATTRMAIVSDQNCAALNIHPHKAKHVPQVAYLNTKIALTESTRAKGLSQRKNLMEHNEAMAFIFPEPQKVSFWMKDTLIPLEIWYFDKSGFLTQVRWMKVEKNPKRPKRFYPSEKQVQVAIEVEDDGFKNHFGATFPSLKKHRNFQLCVWKKE